MARRWTKRRVATIVVSVVLVIVFGRYALSRVLSSWHVVETFENPEVDTAKIPAAGTVLRVGAYNIAHGRGPVESNYAGGDMATRISRLGDIAMLLHDSKLDVVILNEVDYDSAWSGHLNQSRFIARGAGFPYWAEQRNIDLAFPFWRLRFGNVVLSRYPIVKVKQIEYPAYSAIESVFAGRKRGLVCTLQLAPDRQVRVLAVHLEHRSEEVRVASARTIEGIRQESAIPLICAGDFNSGPSSHANAETAADGTTAMDVLFSGGGYAPCQRTGPAAYTYPSADPAQVIDWILIPATWKYDAYRVKDSTLSDHRPVFAVVQTAP